MLSNKFSKQTYLLIISLSTWLSSHADTMDHYMGIVNNIPKMEIKADGQAQIWAKSARNVVLLTCESVAESLVIANASASQQGHPLFCLPATVSLDGSMLHTLVQQTYSDLPGMENDKAKLTVSEVALIGLRKNYPCGARPMLK